MKRFLCFLAIIFIGQLIAWAGTDGPTGWTFQIGMWTGWLSQWYLESSE